MFRLNDVSRLPQAIERLSGLFERMKQQPGFLIAELLQDQESPETLLVLHAWRDIADWQTYQATPEKVAFTASRPAGLYDPVVCGMNWQSRQADGERSGGLLRREIIHGGDVSLRRGEGIAGCQTFGYQDDLPAFAGCTLRLTRVSPSVESRAAGASIVGPQHIGNLLSMADDTFRSLIAVSTEPIKA
jgi:quinol monooxygenase YgiN